MLHDMTCVNDIGAIILQRQRTLDVAQRVHPRFLPAVKPKCRLLLIFSTSKVDDNHSIALSRQDQISCARGIDEARYILLLHPPAFTLGCS